MSGIWDTRRYGLAKEIKVSTNRIHCVRWGRRSRKKIRRQRRGGRTDFVEGKFCLKRLPLKDEEEFDRKSVCGGAE